MSRTTHYALLPIGRGWPLYLLFLPALLLFITACAGNASAEPTPPVIHYGEDVCEFCGMIISDERYAAGYITADGQQHIFDDIGDMVQAHLTKEEQVVAFFVHNSENKSWIRAEKASYVRGGQISTPMLSGLAAFDSPEKAETLAAEWQANVMSFDELLADYQSNTPMPGEHAMEHDH
jgi:copper chaperone NosL